MSIDGFGAGPNREPRSILWADAENTISIVRVSTILETPDKMNPVVKECVVDVSDQYIVSTSSADNAYPYRAR